MWKSYTRLAMMWSSPSTSEHSKRSAEFCFHDVAALRYLVVSDSDTWNYPATFRLNLYCSCWAGIFH